MNRPPEPQLRRMPGSAITALVFLWLIAGLYALAGLNLLALIPLLAAVMLAGAAFSALIAVGVAKRRHWARIAGLVLCTFMVAFQVLPILWTSTPYSEQESGSICLWSLPILFLAMRNTRLWCDNSQRRRSSFLSVDAQGTPQEVLTHYDQVELIENVDDSALRPGMVGMIVDVRTSPLTYEVEFDHPEDDMAVRVMLRPEQIRPAAEPE